MNNDRADRTKHGVAPSGNSLRPGPLLQQMAAELGALAGALEQFQHVLSDMLEEAHVSSELMRRVQAIDATTQSLHALAAVTHRLAANDASGISTEELDTLVPIGQLRQRLLNGPTAGPGDPVGGQVSFF